MIMFLKYRYLWPPRPARSIPMNLLNYYEHQGWIGQFKKNGTCTVLYVRPDKRIIVKTRNNTDHKAWTPNEEFIDQFRMLPGNSWYVFVGEILNTLKIKNTIYLFDLLVDDGQYLVGESLQDRLSRLKKLFPKKAQSISKSHYVITPNLWLAKTIKHHFLATYKAIVSANKDENEGLVLKDPEASLALCLSKHANSGWQVKCRKPTKNYTF